MSGIWSESAQMKSTYFNKSYNPVDVLSPSSHTFNRTREIRDINKTFFYNISVEQPLLFVHFWVIVGQNVRRLCDALTAWHLNESYFPPPYFSATHFPFLHNKGYWVYWWKTCMLSYRTRSLTTSIRTVCSLLVKTEFPFRWSSHSTGVYCT